MERWRRYCTVVVFVGSQRRRKTREMTRRMVAARGRMKWERARVFRERVKERGSRWEGIAVVVEDHGGEKQHALCVFSLWERRQGEDE
jgi:hypothetical protein